MSRPIRIRRPARYRVGPLPGLEDHAQAVEWSPLPPQPDAHQGWLALDGGALGPLFNTPTPEEP